MDLNNKQVEELIVKAQAGDADAFGVLVGYYTPSVKPYVEYLCGNECDSNDVLQDSYIKAFSKMSTYDSRYSMDVWLRSIARNTFIDIKRKQQSRMGVIVEDMQGYDIALTQTTPEDIIIRNERLERLERQLAILPAQYREIIELRFVEMMSYVEIAQRLDMPIGTVKTQLFRAKKLLLKVLGKTGI